MSTCTGCRYSLIAIVIPHPGTIKLITISRARNGMSVRTRIGNTDTVTVIWQVLCSQGRTSTSTGGTRSKAISCGKHNTVFQLGPVVPGYMVAGLVESAISITKSTGGIHSDVVSPTTAPVIKNPSSTDSFPHIANNVRVQNTKTFSASSIAHTSIVRVVSSTGGRNRCFAKSIYTGITAISAT